MTPPSVINFPNRATAIEWVFQNQLARRNNTPEEQEQMIKERSLRVAEARVRGESTRAIADEEGVSPATVLRDIERATASGETVDPPGGTVTGLDGKKHPATHSIFCQRCQRTGPVKDCPRCAELQAKAGRTKKGPRKKKPGSVLYDWHEFERHFTKVAQMPDAVGHAFHVEANSTEYHACLRLLSEFTKVWQNWRKRLSKHQPKE